VLARRGASGAPLISATVVGTALQCDGPMRHADRPAVLLVHGTGQSPESAWGQGTRHYFNDAGYDVCTIRLPNAAHGDIQESGEYLARAVLMLRDRGRSVAIVAHSQGGVVARWALRWWPSTARAVTDVVTLGTPHRGFAWAGLACATPAGCEPAFM